MSDGKYRGDQVCVLLAENEEDNTVEMGQNEDGQILTYPPDQIVFVVDGVSFVKESKAFRQLVQSADRRNRLSWYTIADGEAV
jgi:hypothetical protein